MKEQNRTGHTYIHAFNTTRTIDSILWIHIDRGCIQLEIGCTAWPQFLFLAMCVSLVEDGLTGSAWGDWANYTASPLRAFENELGVQAPVGFWDPVGFTSDGDVASFKRRRSVELKHGRISMMATMGVLSFSTCCILLSGFIAAEHWQDICALFERYMMYMRL